ncbi:hypothetical protein [Shewanella baltica]|uniref:hypothetical protein n=1 Tax=Shewanella baltica TaxID=62322 RepID=UPI0001DB8295|nr:hypothetical protein [Shewanella baltica]ADT94340.1 hypothetical protein Sbal678_2183 [Shewanella baltica OS678]
MFERLEVLSGDLEKGIWAIDKSCITHYGNVFTSRNIQYSDIQVLTRTEQISNVVYIEIKLITGEKANAKLDVKYYSILYDNYTKAKPSSVGVDSTCSNDLKLTDNGHDKENALDLWSSKPSESSLNTYKPSRLHIFFGVLLSTYIIAAFIAPSKNSSDKRVKSILDLSSSQKATICKQYIGSLMGRSKDIMGEYQEGSIDTSYIRYYMDNEYWSFACTFTNDSIVWTGWLMRDSQPKWGRTRFEDEAAISYNPATKIVGIVGHGGVQL